MRKRKLWVSIIAGLLALLMVLGIVASAIPTYVSAESSAEIKKRIEALKEDKKAVKEHMSEIDADIDDNYSEIEKIVAQKNLVDQEVFLLTQEVTIINNQIIEYNLLVADKQEELEKAEEHLEQLQAENKERIRAMEKNGKLSYWSVIFQANSFTDMLDRINMMEEIAASDQQRLSEMRLVAEDIHAAQAELETGRTELEASRSALAENETALEERRGESDDILRQLLEKQDEFQALLDESEAAQDELMKDIAKKEKELKEAKYEEELAKLAQQGKNPPSAAGWIKPVTGYRLTSPFGMRKHPVLGYVRMHNGIDMACPSGTPIYAARAGKVTAASYQAGGAGNYVSINHLDGFSSIYMHMTHYVVSVGQTVAQGQLIGYVGSTGISTGPHLHFGISYAGTYVNPMAYI